MQCTSGVNLGVRQSVIWNSPKICGNHQLYHIVSTTFDLPLMLIPNSTVMKEHEWLGLYKAHTFKPPFEYSWKMGHTCLLTLWHFHLFDHSSSDASRSILPSAACTKPRATLSLCESSAILDTFDSISHTLCSCWWPMGPTHCLKNVVVTYCCSQTGFPHFSMRNILVCSVMYSLLSIYQTTSHARE